jgi:hypothetical protein
MGHCRRRVHLREAVLAVGLVAWLGGCTAPPPMSAAEQQVQATVAAVHTQVAAELGAAPTGIPAATAEAATAVAEATRVIARYEATMAAQPSVSELIQTADTRFDARRLAAQPQAHRGKNLVLIGTVVTATQEPGYTWVQFRAMIPETRSVTESIAVELRPADQTILRGDCWAFFGIADGVQPVTRRLTGAPDQLPLVKAYHGQKASSGNC